MVTLVGIGTIAFDDIRTPFGSAANTLGGNASHFSLASSLFTKVGIVAAVGSDFPAAELAKFRQRGIDMSGVTVAKEKTFRWSGYYEHDMNEAHTLKTDLGPYAHFAPAIPKPYLAADFLFLGNLDPRIQMEALKQVRAVRQPRVTALDTMDYYIERFPEELKQAIAQVDLFFCNEWEARRLFGTPNLVQCAREAMKLGPRWVAIKKGEHGALLFSNGSVFAIPGYPLETVVDPTGAGDSFAGGFLGFLAKHGQLTDGAFRKAAVYGSAVASFTAEGLGAARLASLTLDEVEKRVHAMRRVVEF